MPLYDYDCAACGSRLEVVHGVYAPGPSTCPTCGGGPMKKAIAAAAVHFKGSGWAKRDRRASSASSGSSASRSTDDTASPVGGAGSDSPTDAPTERPAAAAAAKSTTTTTATTTD